MNSYCHVRPPLEEEPIPVKRVLHEKDCFKQGNAQIAQSLSGEMSRSNDLSIQKNWEIEEIRKQNDKNVKAEEN